jgi:hypothetical protein
MGEKSLSTPRLAIGMITAPFNFAKRDQVRDTILQSVVVQRGDMAWRFVVGLESLPLNPSRFRLEREANRSTDVLLLPGALDGRHVAMPCSCIEKVYGWYSFALEQWPRAGWYGKTEDDTYVNVDQLLFELKRLARHPRVYYGLINACGMPPLSAARQLSSGFEGCFLGEFEAGAVGSWTRIQDPSPRSCQHAASTQCGRALAHACRHAEAHAQPHA